MVTPFETDVKWESFLKYGTRQFWKRKSVIYKQGTLGEGFYYLHKGLVKIVSTTVKGNDRLLNIVVPGQIMGIQSMDQQTHFTSAIAAKNSVVYHFSCEQFQEMLTVQPELLSLLTQTIHQKMRTLLFAINMKALTSEEHIATLLLNICDEYKNYEVPLTQQDLADCAGLTRITVYKILKQWKESGIVEFRNRTFTIIDPDLLRTTVFPDAEDTFSSTCAR
ncbi:MULTISPECIES: Crp/Fnr family transcriptional regulator [Brevibacillus]|uniref:Crp/Fnr family transcriptional regulator n=1 Tax=Brevibacillus TaxID=55080 RepID=UPI00203AA4F5|nr:MULTISPECIES: Crp/Fnr family transcriptional regulator [Brevibacillus]MCM3081307.1 Crp/Fnr family transcriptional regulator [Brevibacillus invocatus]MCM3431623.1 Crp/Fnr family transcriptional regulator [Brevibacillus invocatus]MDH4619070.1 Crp/Fnr family transcriptional regulator [Brevibacillus sp. AY1]